MRDTRGEIKAVLFDFGETLLSFGKVAVGELFRTSSLLSYEYLKSCGQRVGNFGYYCLRNLIAIRISYWISNITGRDFDSLQLLKRVNRKIGAGLSDEQWAYLAWLWYEPLSKFGKVEPTLSVTLSTLKKSGLKLGIVSNTFISSSSLDQHLEQLGIVDFFTVRLYSYQFAFRKPNLSIFEAAARSIGERPENILFVGDHINKDIRPALKSGMHAVLKTAYTNEGQKAPKGAWRVDQLCELPCLIEKLNANL